MDAVFRALADASRRELLDRLRAENGQTLGELCQRLDMTRQAVSKHLAILEGANLVLTARLDIEGKPLIGVARGVTDFSWVCYISELAVSRSAQGLGIGKGLMDEARRQLGPSVAISLISMPDAVGFYERIGMTRMTDAFWFGRKG